MKKVVKVLIVLFIILLALAFIIPFAFQGKLTQLAREEANKNLNAEVNFENVSLSLFKNFPNFNLGIEKLSIVGIDNFKGDTLAYIPSIGITLDLMSVISGSTYTIKKIDIESPSISLKVLSDGMANYDIAPESGQQSAEPATPDPAEGEFMLSLQRVNIRDAYFVFSDESTKMKASIWGMNFSLAGDLSADQTTLKINTDMDKVNFYYEGIPYLKETHVIYKADINADLKNEIYTLKKNSLFLNELMLAFDGSVSMIKEDINIVMTFDAPKTDFKNILSLVPAVYSRDFASIKSSGKLGIDGHVKGIYNENTLPAFSFNLGVENGTFQYPDLPLAVTDVNISSSISNKGGDADNTVVDVSNFHLEMGSNPVDIQLLVKTPVSDPQVKGKLKGKIDMGTINQFYPLEADESLKGNIVADISVSGKLSDVENEAFDSFTAIGSMLLQNFEYTSNSIPQPVVISNAQLNFSPQYIDLVALDCAIGKNDIKARGKIENYLAYVLGDEEISGQFTTQSKYLNINELMSEEGEETADEGAAHDTTNIGIIEVPGKIDFIMTSSFTKLVYDNLEMENVNGKLIIKDKHLTLQNLSMNILDGEMVVSGDYNTSDPEKPEFDFDLDIKNVDIQQACNTFDVISQYAPIARKTSGKLSSNLKMKSTLDGQMTPDYKTMVGGGKLQTSTLGIQNINTLNKIAEVLKYDAVKNLSLERILLLFEFVDGKIMVEPFDIVSKDFKGQMAGWTALDQSINYTMNMNIPRDAFGGDANKALDNLVNQANNQGTNFSLGETVSLDVLIGGTLSDPEIKANLKEAGKNLVEDVKKKVDEEIQKQKEELSQQAKAEAKKIIDQADAQAKKLIAEANKQASNIRKSAKDAANTVRSEADKQAKSVEAEGKKNGFLAEAAAKETGKQMRKEAGKQAKNLEDEADRQAKAVVKKAKDEGDKLKQNAQKEADRILGGN